MPRWEDIAAKTYAILAIAAILAVPATLWYAGLGIIAILFVLPLVAWLAARVAVHGVAGLLSWTSRKALEEWEGAYYAFNDVQVRVYEEAGQLWFVADDVLRAVGIKALPERFKVTHRGDLHRVPGTRLDALNLAGLGRLLEERREHDSGRFLLWAQREVVGPWEKRKLGPRLRGGDPLR